MMFLSSLKLLLFHLIGCLHKNVKYVDVCFEIVEFLRYGHAFKANVPSL